MMPAAKMMGAWWRLQRLCFGWGSGGQLFICNGSRARLSSYAPSNRNKLNGGSDAVCLSALPMCYVHEEL